VVTQLASEDLIQGDGEVALPDGQALLDLQLDGDEVLRPLLRDLSGQRRSGDRGVHQNSLS